METAVRRRLLLHMAVRRGVVYPVALGIVSKVKVEGGVDARPISMSARGGERWQGDYTRLGDEMGRQKVGEEAQVRFRFPLGLFEVVVLLVRTMVLLADDQG